jgi:isopenicillin N synthase-like dioxygenase
MTILAMTNTKGGLEVLMLGDRWVEVHVAPHELVVNPGDMMARWAIDRWQSTLHRVVNLPNLTYAMRRRQSIGCFMHPNFDARIECFPTGPDGTAAPATRTARSIVDWTGRICSGSGPFISRASRDWAARSSGEGTA